MSNMSEDIQYAGSDTRPPMLDRTDFESWQQRIRLYCLGKDNGENIIKLINEGPFKMGTLAETLAEETKGALQQGPVRAGVFTDLSAQEKERYKADIRATNIFRVVRFISQGYQNKQRVWTKMTETKFDIEKFDGKNDFALWQVRMKALLEEHGLAAALKELPAATIAAYDNVIQKKAYSALILCLDDREDDRSKRVMVVKGLYVRVCGDEEVSIITRNLKVLSGLKIRNLVMELMGFGTSVDVMGMRIQRTGKVQIQMRDGSSFVLDNVRSPSSAIGFKTPIDMLGFFGWLASIKQGMLEPVKVKCIFLGYRKRYGFSTRSLQGVEFKVEPREESYIEVNSMGMTIIVAECTEVKNSIFVFYYHLARDREQHSTHELFSYREDSNEAAFAVAEAEKIMHMNDMVVLARYASLDLGYQGLLDRAKEKCTMVWRSSGTEWYTLRVVYQGTVMWKEKNGKWSCIYAVGSQEYQMVCTRLDIASADVDRSMPIGFRSFTVRVGLIQGCEEAEKL
ncbi:hypothetical protein Tco_0878366 [Tanacetum coccineum]|uniref:Uncharacterized protein n=2 Tax=Tanacetum coccineum TaxID=301880 RepID=A0ABQ5BXQ0_9ASTR